MTVKRGGSSVFRRVVLSLCLAGSFSFGTGLSAQSTYNGAELIQIASANKKGALRPSTGSQMEFGIAMARRGLWNEALFRFSKVLKERPSDVRVLNNMAVAYEAIGKFDKALAYYKRGLKADQGNRELRKNYAQFVEFYQSLKPKGDSEETDEAEDESEETVASGDDSV